MGRDLTAGPPQAVEPTVSPLAEHVDAMSRAVRQGAAFKAAARHEAAGGRLRLGCGEAGGGEDQGAGEQEESDSHLYLLGEEVRDLPKRRCRARPSLGLW